MRSADYWRERFAAIEEAAHRDAQQTICTIEGYYLDAQRSVQKEIEGWYARFAENNELSLSDARKLLNAGELEELRWSVEQYIKVGEQAGPDKAWLKKLENASARYHISRLEAVKLSIQQQLELLYGNQLDALDTHLRQVIGNGYTYTAYELQKGIGIGWDIAAPDEKKLQALLSKPWTTDNRTFRDRCWGDKQRLVDCVQKELLQGMLRGDDARTITEKIRKRFQVSRYRAARLVHTETTYFNAVSAKESYHDLKVEQVEIIETLDGRTCAVCGEMDGKIIPLSQFEPGVTVPPYHPNCRGTTAPAIDEKYAGERAARGKDGKVYYVPADMKYSEWKKAFVDGEKGELQKVSADGTILSRAVSGALNPLSARASKHAELYYEEVRHMTTDVAKIATATGYSEEQIQAVKDYIFVDEHELGDRIARFDPDFMMAASWQRLIAGKPQPHDLTLIRHEIMERELMKDGFTQDEAHTRASSVYNYAKEACEFYAKLEKFTKD